MKKLSLIILTIILSLGLKAQNPSVAITINNTTPFEVNASFVKNADCQKYSILIGTEAEMQGYLAMFGVPIETLIASWGITYTTDSTYTWTEMTPNTEYNVYALAIGATDSVLSQTTSQCPRCCRRTKTICSETKHRNRIGRFCLYFQ